MRRNLVVGNWKMYGNGNSIRSLLSSLTESGDICAGLDAVVCPPFPYLAQAVEMLAASRMKVGAQNVAVEAEGPCTGEVSARMLADVGCHFVIVGHSERRSEFGESSELVAGKAVQVLANNMVPIVCVGESLAQRQQGITLDVVSEQLAAVFDVLTDKTRLVLAYEPVWAIGTGKTATPQQAQEVHAFLREQLLVQGEDVPARVRILYGGSVKAANAAELFAQPDIDGALVGGASLEAKEFLKIIEAAG